MSEIVLDVLGTWFYVCEIVLDVLGAWFYE